MMILQYKSESEDEFFWLFEEQMSDEDTNTFLNETLGDEFDGWFVQWHEGNQVIDVLAKSWKIPPTIEDKR